MSIKDCLIDAVNDGAITPEHAEELLDDYHNRFEQRRISLGDNLAAAQARADLAASMKAEALELRRRAALTDAARLRVKDFMQSYRDSKGSPDVLRAAKSLLSHYGYRGTSSVRGRTEAITSMAHGKLADFMWQFRRQGLTGARRDKPLMSEIVRELKGEATGNATAKGFADAVAEVMEDLRQRYNNAGGAIARLEKWGLPQTHNSEKIFKAGRQNWKTQIKPLLNADAMLSPLTKQPLGDAGIDKALDAVYDNIVSSGWANRMPNMVAHGKGALASQRQDSRFLVFKNAAAWEKYNSLFGKGDAVSGIFEHINGMARDIGAMEVLGPNPDAMVQYMQNATGHEYGKLRAGKPSLAKQGKISESALVGAQYQIQSLYRYMRGRPEVSSGFAKAAGDVRNIVTASVLGSASIISAVTDPFVARAGRALAGLPITTDMLNLLKMIKGSSRREILRTGIIWEDYLHMINDETRFAGMVLGSDWSQWVVDRSVMISGLKPMTTGRQLVEARAWQAHIADSVNTPFGELAPRFRAAMEGFGINADDWRIFGQSIDTNGFVTPISVADSGGQVRYLKPDLARHSAGDIAAESKAVRHREAAEKLAELLSSWRERSVPAGTVNSRAAVSGHAPRGTIAGELVDSALQFKSFGLSFTSLQIDAMAQILHLAGRGKNGAITAGKYLASLVVPMTLGGAFYTQLKNLADGRDLEPMDTPAFWFQAMITGGGFGLIGDYINASQNRFGQSLAETFIGPGVSFASDAVTLGSAAITQPFGAKRNTGREAIKMMQRYTPVLSSHWATRGIYRHAFLDQLQWLADPEANKAFKSQLSRAKSNGMDYWWRPGEALPRRAPAL